MPKQDINIKNNDECTALHIAVRKGLFEIVGSLLRAGADPQILDGSIGIVHQAIINGHDDISCYLLRSEYGVSQTSETLRYTALMESESVMRAFFSQNSDQRATANEILRAASLESKLASMRFAISNGADVDYVNERGHTVLIDAVSHGQLDAVRHLLNAGADTSVRSKGGKSVLQLAAKFQKIFQKRLSMIQGFSWSLTEESSPQLKATATQSYLKRLTGCFQPENRLETLLDRADFIEALHEDSSHGNIINELLEDGGDLAERTPDGQSLLHLSISSVARVRALLQRSDQLYVDVTDKDGRTALHYAAAACQPAVMKVLLHFGADVNAKDHHGLSTLHFAVGNAECVSIALENGCNVTTFDRYCRTAYYYAHLMEGPNDDVIRLLEVNWVETGAVEIHGKSAKELTFRGHGNDGYEKSPTWVDLAGCRRYSLHRERIRATLNDSTIRTPQASQRFFNLIAEGYEKKRTWEVVENFNEEDFDPKP